MKLITELYEDVRPLVEEAGNGRKNYFIEGVFLQSEIRNRNGRMYPRSVLEREVERYNREFVKENRALGELGHPDSPHINPERVSHMTTSLEMNGNDFVGKAVVMDTPYGNIVRSFIDYGVKFGVSSRGVGTLRTESNGETIVSDDFHLATAADIVMDPSAPEAFVTSLREQHEWVWNNGILKTSEVERLAEQVKKSTRPKKVEVAVFERFLNRLKTGTQIV